MRGLIVVLGFWGWIALAIWVPWLWIWLTGVACCLLLSMVLYHLANA